MLLMLWEIMLIVTSRIDILMKYIDLVFLYWISL